MIYLILKTLRIWGFSGYVRNHRACTEIWFEKNSIKLQISRSEERKLQERVILRSGGPYFKKLAFFNMQTEFQKDISNFDER